jgi:hypothetical protein
MRRRRSAITFLIVILLCTATSMAKADGLSSSSAMQIPDASHTDPMPAEAQFPTDKPPKSSTEAKAEQQLEKERQKQRWQDIKRRSEQLLEVATELKQYVDKSGENVMSLEVIKKAEQMEKLSKDLQKKMKGD